MNRQSASRADELAALMDSVAGGDRKAFGRLYAATSPMLFALVKRIVHSEHQAEEVLQDVFVRVWKKAGRYDKKRARVTTWLATIARNRALDVVRSRRGDEITGVDFSVFEAHETPGPAAAAQSVSAARELSICLHELEADQRQAILMAYFDGLTHSELARATAKPLGTIKTWIRRGLSRLRDCLEREARYETV